ncbi:MAG: peroxiredoxin [Myxococcales bacterium]|nr:peroxiredoxin [Myxococcales bacterium]
MSIKIGDRLPSIKLQEGTPSTTHDMSELFAGKKAVIFAVPGAFTPGCSKKHLPSYIADVDAIKAKGIDLVVCIAVNDAFVMAAWGESQNVGDRIMMLADPAAEYTKAIGLEVEAGSLGGTRSKRYSMLVEDGVVKTLNLEPDSFGISCSTADNILEQI